VGAAVRIGVQGDGPSLGFDLREILVAVRPHPELTWVLRDAEIIGDLSDLWPDVPGQLELRTNERSGVRLTWPDMQRLGEICIQVIDGLFTAYDGAGDAQVQMEAVDSSFWVVWAQDGAVLERVRSAFVVDDYEVPMPIAIR
jgi:hypothetical protein